MKTYRITFLPFDISVDVQAGTKIWDAIKSENLPLKASCGGEGICGDCIVQILAGCTVTKPSAALPNRLIRQGYALACQTEVNDNLIVQLPQFQELMIKSVVGSEYLEEQKDCISGFFEHDPILKSLTLSLPAPTLEDNYSDLKRLEKQFCTDTGKANPHFAYSVMRKLARTAREEDGHVRITYFDGPCQAAIVDIAPASGREAVYGMACDVGTTTVALYLVDMKDGHIVGTASSLNQQIKCGEDIIARINYAQKPRHLEELQHLIALTINNLIERVLNKSGISSGDVYYGSFAGNTTMIHLLLGLEPNYIREEPYVPTFNRVPMLQAKELGFSMNQEAQISCSPSVGSYVGGDITAGVLCTPMLKDTKKTSLFIDAGTNGEIVVGNKEWLMTCACSAGPAFEGGGIKCGMPATAGAIEQFSIKRGGEVSYKSIDRVKPKGLCGSGLVDLIAELFVHGYIDRYGKFREEALMERIYRSENGPAFLIEEAKNTFWGKDIVITERDISNLIRTKGAIFSACSLLLKNVGLRFADIDSLFIAGGFGKHLDVENAVRIGLLPDLSRNKFHYIGNSSLSGAYLILISEKNKYIVNEIADKMTYVELNTEPKYMNEFTGSLFLPHTDMDLFPSVKKIFTNINKNTI
ncbi:MAG: DUF4445 domain-containing protein [Candidatus Aminicenantes bacterium]|nr:DUF4445 domain-containing protein [Candidatus Aminicenantes bacterium]